MRDKDCYAVEQGGIIYNVSTGYRCCNRKCVSGYGPIPSSRDLVVGTLLDVTAGTITFYLNGVCLGRAFDGLKLKDYYPLIGTKTNDYSSSHVTLLHCSKFPHINLN